MTIYLVEDLRQDGKPFKKRRIGVAYTSRKAAEADVAVGDEVGEPARIIPVEIPDE